MVWKTRFSSNQKKIAVCHSIIIIIIILKIKSKDLDKVGVKNLSQEPEVSGGMQNNAKVFWLKQKLEFKNKTK